MRHNHPESWEFNPATCMACEYEYQDSINRRLRELRNPKKSSMEILIEASTIQRYAQNDGYILSNDNAEAYAKEFWR